MNYYRRFLPSLSKVEAPLRAAANATSFQWTEQCADAMQSVKDLIQRDLVLAAPDVTRPFIIDTDASDKGFGGVLSQVDASGKERPVAFAARCLSAAELKYPVIEKECLAVLWAVTDQFHPYVYGGHFLLRTDNQPLSWLKTLKNPSPRLARWILKLNEYDFDIEHRAGVKHSNADALSRLPVNAILFDDSDSLTRLRAEQDTEPEIAAMIRLLTPTDRTSTSTEPVSKEFRKMKSCRNEYKLRSNVLVRGSANGDQLVIPTSRRESILKALHSDATGGHLGREKLIAKLRERYYWYGMFTDAENYCRDCIDCQRRKAANPTPIAPIHPIQVESAFDMVSMDICGPYPTSDAGNKYVLVVTEYVTKWVECYSIPNQEAATVAERFEDFMSRHGTPKTLLTDQGRNFESQLMLEVCRRYGIEKRSTSPYHPQCNGQTERFNRTMNDMLSQYVSSKEKDWDTWLPSVLFAYRSAVHASTGKSPFEMIYGRRPRLPIASQVPSFDAAPVVTRPGRYVSIVKSTIDDLHSQAQVNLRRAHAKQKQQHDADANAGPLRVGDRVLLFTPQLQKGRSRKFHRPWTGPFRVLRQPRPPGVTYSIRDETTGKVVIAHRNRLKLLTSTAPGLMHDSTPGIHWDVDFQEGEEVPGRRDAQLHGAAHAHFAAADVDPDVLPHADANDGDADLGDAQQRDAAVVEATADAEQLDAGGNQLHHADNGHPRRDNAIGQPADAPQHGTDHDPGMRLAHDANVGDAETRDAFGIGADAPRGGQVKVARGRPRGRGQHLGDALQPQDARRGGRMHHAPKRYGIDE